MKRFQQLLLLFLVSVLFGGCSSKDKEKSSAYFVEAMDETINHIHGVGYLGSDQHLFLATHHGLLRFSDGKWYKTSKNNHDFMGFQATDERFYSSGHPMPGSDLKNPLGIIRSSDLGSTLEKIAFYGEIDFHYLAAGYKSHTLYVYNGQQNSLGQGLHYSVDEGESWNSSSMKGISANSIGNIATHPTDSENLGISTNKGLFVSSNYGDEFKLLSSPNPVTTVEYQENSLLYFILEDEKTKLVKYNLLGDSLEELPQPKGISNKNPIMFLATNPENREEITVVSLNNDIFQSKDNGASWNTLVEEGTVKNE